MSVARSRASATEFGGKVYIFGGATGDGVTDLVEMLDPGWDDKIELPVPLKDFESVMLAGKLYIIGGKKLSGGAAVSSRAVYAYDPVTKAISSKAQLPADFYYISAAAAYGKIYLIGSPSASSTTKSLYEYSPGRNQWTLAASIDTVKSGVTEAVFWNERIYMITAYSSTLRTVVTYDPITEQVVSKPNITLSRSSTYKANAIVYGGELYLMSTKTNTYLKCTNTGGTDSWSAGTWDLQSYPSTVLLGGSLYSFPDRALSARDLYYKYSIAEGMNATKCTFYDYKKIINAAAWNNKAFMFVNADSGEYATHFTVYTPPEGIWQDFSQLSAAKSAPGSAFLGGYIYAAGGYSESGGYYSTMDRFSPGETGSTARASMANARSNLALLAAGSKIYAIGGKNAGARALTYVEEYNPATNTWQNRAAIPAATANMASAVYNGNIYIFGGNDASKTALSTVRMYNPTTNIWTTKASMPKALYGAGAGTIGDKIYVAGGFTAGDDTEPKTASKILYVYDPVNNTWDSTKQAMPSPLGFAGSVSETNLYMAGGTDGTNEIALVHEYSPTLNKWFTWDGPKITSYLNAAVITDGNLFVFGGQNMSEYFSQAEYAPIDSFTESYLHLGDETVNLSGNFARNYVDMEYKAPGFNVVFGRTYNSHDGRGTSEGNVIGMGWSFSFQGSIDVSGNDAVVRVPNGSGYIFAQDTVTGEYTAKDSRMTLVKDGDNHIMTSPDQYTYEFNNKGKLFRMKDPYGNAITLTIDTLGRVSGVTDQVGRVSEIHYNSMGRISSIYDPAGRQIIYTYNDAGQLIRTVGPTTSYHRYYHYDDAIGGYLSAVTDTTGITIEAISYEMPTGKKVPMVKSIKDINGRIATYSYDNATGMVKETDQNGNESSTWYDRAIYPVHTKDAEGRETHTEYYKDGAVNRYGEVHTFTDKYGSTTSYERDENGNVTRVINPDNSVKGYKYNDKNMLTQEENEEGRLSFYVYAADGVSLSKEARPLNGTDIYTSSATQSKFAITSYAYEPSHISTVKGLLKTETNPEGGVTAYTYDSRGDVASVKTPRNITTTYTHNILSWLKTETNSKGTTTHYYDKLGSLISSVYPDGGADRKGYDYKNRLTRELSPEQYALTSGTLSATENIISTSSGYGHTEYGTTYVYNNKDQIESVQDPMGYITSYEYDIYGNPTSETKPNGALYYYEYDVMNRLEYEKFAKSSSEAKITLAEHSYGAAEGGGSQYGASHYIETKQYLTATAYKTTRMSYDFAGREIRCDDPLSNYTLKEYYKDGSLKTETDELGNKTFYTYNGQGLMSGRWQQRDTSDYIYTGWEYDKCMRLRFERSSIDYTAEGVLPSTNMLHTEYIYNADGTLAEKKTSGGKRTTYGYDSEGNVTSEYLYTDSSNYNYKTYTYNHRGQTKTESLRVASADIGLTGIMNATLTTLTTLTTTNAYDKDGYLASILRPDDGGNIVITYGRDAMGRERSITTAKGASSAAIEYDYSPMGDKTSATDARGKTTIYTYDKRGFLTHITDPEGGVTHYEYDRAGRKIAEVSPKNYVTGQTINAMTRTTYAYDKMDRPTGTARVSKNAAGAWVTVEIGSSDYDAAGNLKKSADKVEKLNNVYTIYDYDKAGRLTETKLPRERNNLNQIVYDESARVWDAAGRIISETDFNGHQTIYTYDDDGNVLSSTKEGVTNAYTWDKLGNKLSETDGNGNTTLWQYNAFGKVKKTIYPTLTYPTVEFGDADDGSDFDLSGVVTGYTNSAASGNIKEVRLNADCSFKSPYHHFKWWYAGRTL